jgi:glycosyltransferase involved in cell wall biosynthesis
MRVLHVINTLDLGGAERLISEMVPLFAAEQVHVTVLVLELRDRRLYERLAARGIDVVASPSRWLYSPRQVSVIRRLAKAKAIDIIHAHLFPAMYWAAFANFLSPRVPVLVTEHSTWNGRRRAVLRPMERFMYSRCARVACVSDPAVKALQEWLPKLADRISVVENGIDLTAFGRPPATDSSEQCTVVSVGRLTKPKAMDVLIRAVAALPGVTAWIVGDGPMRRDLEQLAASLRVGERVRFVGARMDVQPLLESAMIYVQSSAFEGFGLATVEAMHAGLPVIVSDVSGLREVVGEAGLKFAAGSHMELADRLRELTSDAGLRAELGARSRVRALRFSISQTVARYITLYDMIRPAVVESQTEGALP